MLQLLSCSAYKQVVLLGVTLAYHVTVFKTSVLYLFYSEFLSYPNIIS